MVLAAMMFRAMSQERILSTKDALQRSSQSLEQANSSFEHANILLQTALQNMAHGLCMFDRNQCLVICNERYGEMYNLAPEVTTPGTSLRSILEARISAGTAPQDKEQYLLSRLKEVAEGTPYYAENELSDGRVYAVNHQPMPDGGWVAIHQDVTEQKKTERALVESTEALKNSNAKFGAALQNMSQGLCMIDASEKILVANERYRQIPQSHREPGEAQNHARRNYRISIRDRQLCRSGAIRIYRGSIEQSHHYRETWKRPCRLSVAASDERRLLANNA